MIDFHSQGNFTFLFATVFNWNEPERQLIDKLILPMGRFEELSSLCCGSQNLFWFQYKEHKVCLTKIPTNGIFKLLSGINFQICALWHAIFRRKNRRIALLLKRLWYCNSRIYLLETSNSVINCIITVPDCGLPNGTKLSNFANYSKCSAHFSKGKMLYFPLKFCGFQYTNSTCIHNNIFRDCIMTSSWNVCYNKEKR